ncbi:MAG TPA: hypothetical protein VFQ85_00410 [Mycobacteriales bacterium]|nr:hypothetical protein [Mycobacteriales bacterium]
MNACGEPVVVPGVFSAVSSDTGHRCQREPGHPGAHRWQARWAGLAPHEVEAEIARDLAEWEPSDDDEDLED